MRVALFYWSRWQGRIAADEDVKEVNSFFWDSPAPHQLSRGGCHLLANRSDVLIYLEVEVENQVTTLGLQ